MSIIKVENLGKKYVICHDLSAGGVYRSRTLRESLAHTVRGLYQRMRHPLSPNAATTEVEELWALKNLDFEIEPGDRVGIIGRNGAGKSTLLKVLSRITEPTTGRIEIDGRVASLLEVGTGFHPELTGRENIYLNGAVLGMTRAEIKAKFDEIVAFSEIEKFLDTPVKRYSSGMYVRLAFSVAAHLEPEILIVDEVLAVGDVQFQRKCLGKMEEVGKEGRTVLFVSHNMAVISNLCQTGLMLNEGELEFYGRVSDAVTEYYRATNQRDTAREREFESDTAELLGAELIGLSDLSEITIHDELTVRMRYRIKKQIDGKCVPNFHFFVADGSYAFVDSARDMTCMPPGIYCADCRIPPRFLNEGAYFVGVALTTYFESGSFEIEFFDRNALTFNVVDPMDERSNRYSYGGPIPGVVRPQLDWTVAKESQ
jgi:lipopolysaccharide transport system ATP-binding protein